MLKELISKENIILNLKSTNKEDLINEMIEKLNNNGYIKDVGNFRKDIYLREEQSNTGIGFGVAIPHAKSDYVNKCSICIGISRDGIDYNSLDNHNVHIVFMLAIEGKESDLHLRALATLSRKLIHDDFRQKLLNSNSTDEIYDLICE